MRSLRKSWIGIILAILFMASIFLFRGASRYSNLFNSDNVVANVSGTPISTTKFLRVLEMNINQFGQMLGKELNGDEIRSFQIHQLVLQNLVNNAIFENEFEKINFVIDETIIAKKTKERFPNFYENNKIDDDSLNTFLRQQRLKIDDLVNIISYEIKVDIFDDLFFQNNYPEELKNRIEMFDNQLRKVDLLEIPINEIKLSNLDKSKISKDDKELIDFFNTYKNNYMSKEKRDIAYIVLNKNDYKERFIPSENDIINYFDNNKNIFKIPEKRSFKQFNFKSKNEADDFKISITGLSKNKILDYATNNSIIFNDFKELDNNQVLEELASVIFKLNINDISDVIKTTLAHHIIILDEIKPEQEPTFVDFKEEIKNTLTNVNLDDYFNQLKSTINEQILKGLNINEIANDNNLNLKKLNKATNEIQDKNITSEIVSSGFIQNKDFVSDLIDYDSDTSYLFNVENIYFSEPMKLDSVLNNVKEDFLTSKKIKFAEEFYNTNIENDNLNKFKNYFNIDIKNLSLKNEENDLPINVINKIFESKINDIVFIIEENKIYISKIKDVEIPIGLKTANNISLMPDLKSAFGNEVIKSKDISFNDELIDGLLSQYK